MNTRIPRSPSCIEECKIKIETAIRIRPLLKKERGDTILLQERNTSNSKGSQAVLLKPLHPNSSKQSDGKSLRDGIDPDSTSCNVPREYQFNHVLPENTSQDKMYYTLGLPIVTATMSSLKDTSSTYMPKSHLLILIGVQNSGKTYTCFGGMAIPKRRTSQDGLVPRLLDGLFSQSSHTGHTSKGFTVRISIMQVTQPKGGQCGDLNSCQIYDLLANTPGSSKIRTIGASPKKKKQLNVRNMAARFERTIPSPVNRRTQKAPDGGAVLLDAENLEPTIYNCYNNTEAREALKNGLSKSQKTRTGNQKSHLYITIQPVIDGSKIGDKICILDMSGLDNESMIRTTRGKEVVVDSNDEAAKKSIFNCLGALKHNSNVLDSKSSSSRENLKPVPFRHHKTTMLLNPLFLQSSFVKITLLLTAYPGHIDFQEKQILLKDVEMLQSSTLGVRESVTGVNDTMNERIKSEISGQNNHYESHNDVVAVDIHSTCVRDEGQNYYPPKRVRNLPVKVSPRIPRIRQADSMHNSKNDYLRVKSSTRSKLRVESLKIPIAVDAKKKSNARTISLKQQDRSSLICRKANERNVEPSAPAFSEVQESYINSETIEECAVDFPGLQIIPNTERKADVMGFPIKSDHSVHDTTKPCRNTRATKERVVVSKIAKSVPHHEERFAREIIYINPKEELKSPLGQSSLENCVNLTTYKKGNVRNALKRNKDNQFTPLKEESTSNFFEADFTNFENNLDCKNDKQIKRIEKILNDTLEEKTNLEEICFRLEKENTELKQLSHETVRKISELSPAEQEEEDVHASRRLRLEAQKKIKSPIHEHLERVNYIYKIKNQWCMTNKTHFSLTYPEHFQRAPILDMRDKERKNLQGLKNLTRSETCVSDGIKGKRNEFVNMKTNASSQTRQILSQRLAKPPESLSALRRLVGKTLKD